MTEKQYKIAAKLSDKPFYNVPEDGVRSISHKIMKNKGLTRHRKKIDRNPRLKNRMKFEKAEVKQKVLSIVEINFINIIWISIEKRYLLS